MTTLKSPSAQSNDRVAEVIQAANAAGPDPSTERIEAALVSPAAAYDTERIKVPIADISFHLHNAHKHSPEAINFLAASIAERGLINEPLVRLEEKTQRYAMIAGEARVKAMIQLGWESTYVRCLKGALTDQQVRDLALIDNLLKEDIDPLAFGLYCLDEKNRTGRSARELAKVLSNKVDASTITRAIALANNLTGDIHELIRSGKLPPAAARPLTGLKDDDTKRRFARMYVEGKVKTAAELAAAVKAAKNGKATGATANFTCEENGVRIAVTLPPGADLAAAAAALRIVLEDLRKHAKSGLNHWKTFLAKKKDHAKKAAELEAAQKALSEHAQNNGNGDN